MCGHTLSAFPSVFCSFYYLPPSLAHLHTGLLTLFDSNLLQKFYFLINWALFINVLLPPSLHTEGSLVSLARLSTLINCIHSASTFRSSYSNSNSRRSFDKSSSPSGGGGYAAAAAASSERERGVDLKGGKAVSPDSTTPETTPEMVKGIYKNKQFMTQLTTIIGCNMRVSG